MAADRATPAPPDAARPSRFTRLLYVAVVVLSTLALAARLVEGARTGQVDWLAMAAPAAVLLGLTGIVVGPRRPAVYYPLLTVSFALLVVSYAIPRHRPPAPAGTPAAGPVVPR